MAAGRRLEARARIAVTRCPLIDRIHAKEIRQLKSQPFQLKNPSSEWDSVYQKPSLMHRLGMARPQDAQSASSSAAAPSGRLEREFKHLARALEIDIRSLAQAGHAMALELSNKRRDGLLADPVSRQACRDLQ